MIPTNLDELTKWINSKYDENFSKKDVEFISVLEAHTLCERLEHEHDVDYVKMVLNTMLCVNLDDDGCPHDHMCELHMEFGEMYDDSECVFNNGGD